jgi:hypothetical protein
MTPDPELLRDLDRPTGWVLMVEGVEQSYVDVADPSYLAFEYMQHMALVLDATCPRPQPLRTLHLGGGAGTMARWLSWTRPGSTHRLIEHSPAVVDLVAQLELPEHCEVTVADARVAVDDQPAAAYDLLLWDLYDGPRAVTTALTLEALSGMHATLAAPAGVIALNVSDAAPFDVVRPVAAALRMLFADVCVLAEPGTLRGRRSGNCVLAGTVSGRFDTAVLTRLAASCPTRARLLAGPDLTAFVGAAAAATDASPLPPPDPARGRAFL